MRPGVGLEDDKKWGNMAATAGLKGDEDRREADTEPNMILVGRGG